MLHDLSQTRAKSLLDSLQIFRAKVPLSGVHDCDTEAPERLLLKIVKIVQGAAKATITQFLNSQQKPLCCGAPIETHQFSPKVLSKLPSASWTFNSFKEAPAIEELCFLENLPLDSVEFLHQNPSEVFRFFCRRPRRRKPWIDGNKFQEIVGHRSGPVKVSRLGL